MAAVFHHARRLYIGTTAEKAAVAATLDVDGVGTKYWDTTTNVLSIWDGTAWQAVGAGAVLHNTLPDLQGGQADQYYHTNAAQHTAVVAMVAAGVDALTQAEVDQLENIGAVTISTDQWGYLGVMDQSVATGASTTFANVYVPDDGVVGVSGGPQISYDSNEGLLRATHHLEMNSGNIQPTNPTGQFLGLPAQRWDIYARNINLSAAGSIVAADDSAAAFRVVDAGGADDYLTVVSADAQRALVVNEDGVDIDFVVEASGVADALIVRGSNGQITLGALGAGHLSANASSVIASSANITMADGATIGQAAGPLLTFDDTLNYLEITGCTVSASGDIDPTASGQDLGNATHLWDLHARQIYFGAATGLNYITIPDSLADALEIMVGPAGDEYIGIRTAAQRAVTINEGGADIDFTVEASGVADALIVRGSNGQITLGALGAGHLSADASGVISSSANIVMVDGASIGITGNELLTVNAAGNFTFSGITSLVVPNGCWVGADAACSWVFDSTNGDVTTLDKVGIGIVAPAELLHVSAGVATGDRATIQIGIGGWAAPAAAGANSNGDKIQFYKTGIEKYVIGIEAGYMWFQQAGASSGFKFYDDVTAVVTILGGNVGIGTTGPLVPLHIEVDDLGALTMPVGNVLLLEQDNNVFMNMVSGTADHVGFRMGDPDDTDIGYIVYENNNDAMAFGTNAAERMRINSSGNVGIGTTAPGQIFDVNAGSGNMIADGYDNHPSFFEFKENAVLMDTAQALERLRAIKPYRYTRLPFVSTVELVSAAVRHFNLEQPEDARTFYENLQGAEILGWINAKREKLREERRQWKRYQREHYSPILDDPGAEDALGDIIGRDEDGNITGYSLNNYVGLLHAVIQELDTRLEKLEAR